MRIASGVMAAAIMIGVMTSRPVAQGGASPAVQSTASETVTAENAAAVIEKFERSIRVARDGRADVTTRATVRVREASAVQALGHVYLFYLPTSESMELVSMTVRKPDGREVKVDVAALKELPPTESGAFEGPTFSDMRVKQIAVPALGIGDTLSYESQAKQHTPFAPGHFWSETSFNRSAIVLDESFELDWAADLPLTVRVGDDVTEQQDVVAEQGRRRRRWTHSQREITEADRTAMSRQMEALGEGRGPAPDIQMSTFSTWDAVADWYRRLSKSAEAVSPAIREKARALTETAATPEARLAALHKFVAQDVRYVSLAFGNGRYQPRGADLVLSSQYGDCKDKHALLASLASAVGLTVEPVLINTTRQLDDMFPSPSQFNHVISLVSGHGLATTWIDGTAAVSRPGVLFEVLRGKKGLKAGEPVDFVDTPSTAEPERITVTTTGTYESDGKYRATVRREFQGDTEMLMRQVMAASDQQSRRRVAHQTAANDDGYGKNARVVAVTTAEPLDLDQPFWWQYEVEVTYGSPVRAEAYSFWIPSAEFDLPDADDDASEPVDLGVTTFDAITRLHLPPGLSITPPVPVAISNEFAAYTSKYGVEKGAERNVLTIERRLTTKVKTVAASDRSAYRAFQRAADGDRRQMFAVAAATADAVRASAPRRSADVDGYSALQRGDLEAAVRFLKQAVAENPQHKSAWNNLGRALAGKGEWKEAIEAYDQQIAVNAFDEYAYNNRGLAEWTLKQFPAAEASFRKQIEVSPLDQFAHLNLGRLLLERKRPAEAVGVLEKAVSVKGDDAWSRSALGRALAEAGRGPEALASFKRAVEMSPAPGIWNDAAWWMAENDLELPLALDYARSAVGSASAAVNTASIEAPTIRQIGQTSSLAAYWDTLGWVHFKLAQFNDALRYLRAAWQVQQVPTVGEHLGKTYERLGRPRQAFVVYRTALGLDNPSEWLRDRVRHLALTLKPAPNTADSQSLALGARTVAVRALPGVREPRDVVLVVGADGAIVAARMVPEAAPEIESVLSRVRVPIDAPDAVPFKLVMRAAVACRDGRPACTMVIYRPEDAARRGSQEATP